MSSYYTAAELEAMRKARIKQELVNSIKKLKEQMQEEHDNRVEIDVGSKIEMSVFAKDDSIGGYNKCVNIDGTMLLKKDEIVESKRIGLDFSDLLISTNTKPTKLELELNLWIKKVDERLVLSEKDEKDRVRLVTELEKTIKNSNIDIEDKINYVKMRVSSYLQGSTKVTEKEINRIQSIYYEYCALCKMLDVKPTEIIPYRVEQEVLRMTSIMEKRKQDEYIMDVIEEIMESLGCHVKDDAVLDHTIGQMYSVDGHPLCEVFVGNDGTGIMFEPVGESKEGSLEKLRQIENSANSICSLYSIIEKRAAEKGVILKRVYLEPAKINELCVQTDISERSVRKRQRKTSVQKQRALNLEG